MVLTYLTTGGRLVRGFLPAVFWVPAPEVFSGRSTAAIRCFADLDEHVAYIDMKVRRLT